MEIHVTQQAAVFLWIVAGGMLTGFIYEIFRLSRRLFNTPDIAVFVCDIIFWLIAAVLSFGIILHTNSGELRWFLFAGFGIGGILYFSLLSGIASKLLVFMLKTIIKLFFIIRKILYIPLKLLKKPLGLAKKKASKKAGKIKSACGRFKKKIKSEFGILKKIRKTS